MPYTIRIRRDTSANWAATNPTLALGELGYDTTTGQFKVGTGLATWTALSYTSAVGALDSLTDVQVSSLQDGDVLQYNASLSQWVNSQKTNLTDGGNF